MKRILVLIALSLLTAMMCAYYWRVHSMPYFLSIIARSSTDSIAQVFYDVGKGFREEDSKIASIRKMKNFNEIIYSLPTKKIKNLRFDPFNSEGSVEIRRITLRGKKWNGKQFEILHEFDLEKINAVQQVKLTYNQSGTLIATSHQGAKDPIIDLAIGKTLDHWVLSDFFDREWITKSTFFALLITPIVLSLSLHEKKKVSKQETIVFAVNNEKHSLKGGGIFHSKPQNCYQDTTTENLRSIIKEIIGGKDWRLSIKEKFRKTNPWLYSIITNPIRTKFIDQFIKPKNSTILDIGAGWGQFAIKLAYSNEVCTLEPTPERLKFINAVAQQEHVDQNIFFIGADYHDIKFESKFDLILCIGVLEWVGSFRDDAEPSELQLSFLSKAKKDLNHGGRMVIGIENRIGLKYLMGAPDDHTGLAHISYLEYDSARKKHKEKTMGQLRCFTYGMEEYNQMLTSAGFTKIQFFAALPDYKLPQKIFPIEKNKCSLNEFFLEGNFIKEHSGLDGTELPSQSSLDLNYKTLASMNIAHHFAPSYFIEAS